MLWWGWGLARHSLCEAAAGSEKQTIKSISISRRGCDKSRPVVNDYGLTWVVISPTISALHAANVSRPPGPSTLVLILL